MPRPWRIRYSGAKYHVTSRGNGRELVFTGKDDYSRFLDQLAQAMEQDDVILYAYVLMPNHYHLFIETPLGNIQRFMQRLNTAYSMYFRYKKARPGHCFQGRYGAKLINGDDYILRVTRYIHLNPVKIKSMKGVGVAEKRASLDSFRWSSYPGYAGLREPEEIVDYQWLNLMGRMTRKGKCGAYRKYVEGMLDGEDELLKEADGLSRYAVGDDHFREQVESDLKDVRENKGVTGDIIWTKDKYVGIATVEEAVAAEFGVAVKDMRVHGRRAGLVKAVVLELCCKLTGKTQREISRYFGYGDETSVGKQRKVLAARLVNDMSLEKRLARLSEKLSKSA